MENEDLTHKPQAGTGGTEIEAAHRQMWNVASATKVEDGGQPVGPVPTDWDAPRSQIVVPRSAVLKGIQWLGSQTPYPETEKRGDTFPITWGPDDHLYTSAGDPLWTDKLSGLDVERFSGMPPDYNITRLNPMSDYTGWGGAGPKPTGMICVQGVLYLAFQNLTGSGKDFGAAADVMNNYGHGYDAQIISSHDLGKTWTPQIKEIAKPMFPGRMFGSPAFINFGKDNAGARDEYVYAISGEGWDNGSQCRLGRVKGDRIMDAAAWEWAIPSPHPRPPTWTSRVEDAWPVLSHPGYLGMVEMVYIAPLKRYLLLGWRNKVKSNPRTGSELIVYDAPEPWGPFTLVYHEDFWEERGLNPYNPRLPLKWFDADRLEGWLLFSGSWHQGTKLPFYRAHVRRFRLLRA